MDFATDMTVTINTTSSTSDRMVMLMSMKEDSQGRHVPNILPDQRWPVVGQVIKAGDYKCEMVADKSMKYLLQIVDLPGGGR